jgi:KipI family sensor histidine kinase inhibitor
MSRRLLTCGEHAVLVELDGLEEVLALDGAVRAAVAAGDAAFADLVDVVTAARTVLLVVREGTDVTPVRTALRTLSPPALSRVGPADATADTSRQGGSPHVVEILVHYDGADLLEICERTGLASHEVVAAHTQTPWRFAFAGFAPGFAYLAGGDHRLRVPRRSEPRTSVPAGSVGLAGEFSAVYPRSSPGGWQLLGHTDAILWDAERQPPALLQPGSVVRFVDVDSQADVNIDADNDADTYPDAASR